MPPLSDSDNDEEEEEEDLELQAQREKEFVAEQRAGLEEERQKMLANVDLTEQEKDGI